MKPAGLALLPLNFLMNNDGVIPKTPDLSINCDVYSVRVPDDLADVVARLISLGVQSRTVFQKACKRYAEK